jgi:peptidoglycan hydrolase-like protein with peptidoglycan-binding domain
MASGDGNSVDDELDFDFFADEQTREAVPAERRRRFGLSGPPSSGGLPPDQVARRRRMIAAIAAAIIVLIIIVVVVTGGSSSPAGSYRSYLGRLAPIAADSRQVGGSLEQSLARLGKGSVTKGQILSRLDSLIRRALRDLGNAARLKPPTGLAVEHAQALAALDFRVRGLQALHDTLARALGAKNAGTFSSRAGAAVDRLVTSDVIWHDRVVSPIMAALQQVHAAGASAPQSQFITDPNLSSQQALTALLQPRSAVNTSQRLSLGDHGPAVVAWQKQLNRWLHLTAPTQTPLTADGSFGPGTQAATQAFQRAQRITPDGIVGPATRRALQTALTSQKTSKASSG